MTRAAFALFQSPVGHCGIAWTERGVAALQLPESRDADTRARLQRRFPAAAESEPPPAVAQAVDGIVALLNGRQVDLSGIALDLGRVSAFNQQVYEVTRTIAPGDTLAYGEIARRIGAGATARAVGQALARNPIAILIPCHRVLASDGKLGGFSAAGGKYAKLRLLALEGRERGGGLFDGDGALGFDPLVAVEHLRASDARLAQVIEAAGPLRMQLKRNASVFAALAESIVYQQLNGRAAATIHARVCALFPRPHDGLTAEKILHAPDLKLRAAGLSRSKLLALKDLAAKTADGVLPTLAQVQSMADEEIVERLIEVRGIGRWTAQMFLMFRLGRPDVLPVDDYGVRNGFRIAFGKRKLPEPRQLEKHARRWRPYRSAASWYLWRAADTPGG